MHPHLSCVALACDGPGAKVPTKTTVGGKSVYSYDPGQVVELSEGGWDPYAFVDLCEEIHSQVCCFSHCRASSSFRSLRKHGRLLHVHATVHLCMHASHLQGASVPGIQLQALRVQEEELRSLFYCSVALAKAELGMPESTEE